MSLLNIINKYISNLNHLYQSDIDIVEKTDEIFKLFKEFEEYLNKNTVLDDEEILIAIKKAKEKYIKYIRDDNLTIEDINLLKDMANEFEFIETSIVYSKNKKLTISHDLVKKIIFDEKNLYHSKTLIEKYPYMINMFNEKDSIILKVINNFLTSLEKLVNNSSDKKEFYYYSEILDLILSNSKIKIDWGLVNILDKIILLKKNKPILSKKKKERYDLWLKFLSKKLNKESCNFSFDELNTMYDVDYKKNDNLLYEAYSFAINNGPKEVTDDSYIITIDGEGTTDRDDGLAIKKTDHDTYLLDIIIADPNTYFGIDSKIIKNARFKNQTLYFGDNEKNNMFPDEVVSNYLSLDERKNRYARIYSYEIDKYGNVISFNIKKSNIIVSKNLTYIDTDKILSTGDERKKYFRKLILLKELSDIIGNRFSYNLKDYDISRLDKINTNSETLVANFMIFNNYYVAKFFKEHSLPFVFRHHDMTKKIDIDDLKAFDNSLSGLITSIEKIGLASDYSTSLSNHDGLDLGYYSHTTSPIRRYADILAADCEDNYFFNNLSDGESYKFTDNLDTEVKYINNRNIELLEYQINKMRIRK